MTKSYLNDIFIGSFFVIWLAMDIKLDLNTIIQILTPVVLAIWLYYKERQAAKEKRIDAGFTYTQAKEASTTAYGEGVRKNEASQLASITEQLLVKYLALTDGNITGMKDAIDQGNVDQAIQQAKILSDQAVASAQLIASFNQMVGQQAKILSAILGLLDKDTASQILSADVLSRITSAAITTPAEDKVAEVVKEAITTHEGDKVVAIVKAEPNDKT